MQRNARVLLALLALIAVFPDSVAAQQTQDLKTIEEGLKAVMVGKVVTLRAFYRGSELQFDSTGRLVEGGKPGPWTLYGKVQVTNVRVRSQDIEIEGHRIFLQYEENQGWKHLNSGEPVTIKVAYSTSGNPETEIREALRRVLLAPGETIADVAPPYWKGFLRKEMQKGNQASPRPASGEDGKQPEPKGEPDLNETPRIRVSVGVQDARVLKKVEPRYPEIAKRRRVQGEVRLEAVIGADGRIKNLEIVGARGMGLEEAVIEAVSQWEYSPTLLGGRPVEVETVIIVRFRMY